MNDRDRKNMKDAKQFLSLLAGTWHLDRQIIHQGRPQSRFRGLAHIRPSDIRGRLSYSEEGRFVGEQVDTHDPREFVYKIKDSCLEVLFADAKRPGEAFMSFDFQDELIAHDTYISGEDIHASVYEIINADHYNVDTTISGPDKDLRLVTQYRRL